MEALVSITDELREWYRDRIFMANGWAEIDTIADRIDAAHRAALEKLAAQMDESERSGFDQGFASADDWLAQNEDAMAEHGWVRLPVDADGVTIRPGDRLDWKNGNEITHVHVHSLILDEFWPSRWDYEYETDDDGEIMDSRECARLTMFAHSVHHHAPTVEDVLREFAERYLDYEGMPSAGRRGVGEALMDEYAAKLRLAGSDAE